MEWLIFDRSMESRHHDHIWRVTADGARHLVSPQSAEEALVLRNLRNWLARHRTDAEPTVQRAHATLEQRLAAYTEVRQQDRP